MNIRESFKIALRALGANKARAVLTMLGVIIGVSSVILLVSIGAGVKNNVLGQFSSLGSNLIYVMPGDYSSMTSGGGGTMTAANSPIGVGGVKLTMDDVDLLAARLTRAIAIPIVEGGVTISNGDKKLSVSFMSSDERMRNVMKTDLVTGRMYNRSEVGSSARVVVLGYSVATELFNNGAVGAVGRAVRINGQTFRVIGVAAKKGGGMSGSNQDLMVQIPYTTGERLLDTKTISAIAVSAQTSDDIALSKAQINAVMRPRYGTDVSAMTQDQMLGMVDTIISMMTYMLAGIASISLLVGGIGIMNIMLVSVSERTREIGIRKAVGARTYDIMAQFVIEALVLAVFGGCIGIGLGAAGAGLIGLVLPTTVTLWSVLVSFFFSLIIGVFFGVYPAYKAAQLDPIEALRYE